MEAFMSIPFDEPSCSDVGTTTVAIEDGTTSRRARSTANARKSIFFGKPGTPEPQRQPISGTGSSESSGMGTHPSPRLSDDKVINGPEGHECGPVHVMRAPRTLHSGRLELPVGVNNLGEDSQLRQDSAIAEEAQLESTEERNDGRRPLLGGGRKLWSEKEIAILRGL
uniref:Uncharacterized protein n=1 Tax=Ascaris lumbricoides TaxID=6252 RepID=A0A9J2QAV7_ASCLU